MEEIYDLGEWFAGRGRGETDGEEGGGFVGGGGGGGG